jgi:hypothetical protein
LQILGEARRKQTIRHLCRTDLFFLLAFALRRADVRKALLDPKKAAFLQSRCKEVQENPDDHLDLWAREHYKSTIITFALTIQDILKDPEITIGIFSHTRPIAKNFLRQIKEEFTSNDFLKWAFDDILYDNPETESPKWSEEGGITVKRKGNPKEPTVSAWGLVDGMPTSAHFKLRVYDDVVTLESVNTPEQINKTTEAWELSDNLGSEGGTQRYIGTRYHLNDTYAEMIKRGITVRKYPGTHNGRLDGKPVLFTDKYWAHKLKTQSRKTLAAQMMQNPLADSDASFLIPWLRSYDIRPRVLNVYIMGDPSKGKKRKNDSTSIAVLGVTNTGVKLLVDGYCHRMSLSQRWHALRGLYLKWSQTPGVQLVDVGWERYGAQTDDEYFEERMTLDESRKPENERAIFPIRELAWTNEGTRGEQGKTDRVERLEPDFRNGRFLIPNCVIKDGKPMTWSIDMDPESDTYGTVLYHDFKGLTKTQRQIMEGGSPDLLAKPIKRLDSEKHPYDLTVRLIEEYSSFPFGEHDDLIDAASRIYDMQPTLPTTISPSAHDRTYHDS